MIVGRRCRGSIFTTILLFGISWSNAFTQQNDSSLTVPVMLISGLVFMQGEVNSSAALNVILDSGAGFSIINPLVAEKSGLTSTRSTEAAGIAKGSSQTLHLSDDCELRWGNRERQLRLINQQCASISIDYIAAQVGKRVDALFGSNLFLHYRIAVDYEHQRVTFTPALSAAPPQAALGNRGSAIPIQIVNNAPYVEASIQGEDGKKIEARFLVDSGTAGAMILSRKFLDAHPGLVEQTHFVDTPTVIAVGGAIQSKRVRLPEVILGPFLLHGVVAVVPESSLGVLSDANIAGFIGAGILDRFTVIWDYAGKNMFLSPNHALGTPFDTDASGLHLVSPGPEYQRVIIDSVLPGSPAAMAGLKQDDEILAVNAIGGLPLWKVTRVLRQAGTSVLLTVQRKTRVVKFTLPLRSPFPKAD